MQSAPGSSRPDREPPAAGAPPAGRFGREYAHLFACPHPVFILDVSDDARFQITAFNAAEERLVGLSSEETSGRFVDELFPADVARALLAKYRHCVETRGVISYDEEIDVPAGHRHCATTLVPVVDDAGRVRRIIGVSRDVTDEKNAVAALRASEARLRRLAEAEERARQSQKLEALGLLAGGLAHDFNNLLSVILSYAEFLGEDLEPEDPRRADVAQVKGAGERAMDLTRQLLAFSRNQELEPRTIDLRESVRGIERLLRRMIPASVQIVVVHAPALGGVRADPGQVEQILLNLALNARDAMPTGGTLAIKTANVLLDAAAASELGTAPGAYVTLSVTDEGIGMDAETRARACEPFFTTKEAGKGTGLGLATVLGVVRQRGGAIRIESAPGRGTSFEVYLPRVGDAAPSVSALRPPSMALQGTETILVVEDESHVRALAGTILRRAGYHVLEAQSAGDALLIGEQHGGAIDLLFTDLVMPYLHGEQLAERLTALRPRMKVLYVSGYGAPTGRGRPGEPGIAFIQKPITPEALCRKVRLTLDGETP